MFSAAKTKTGADLTVQEASTIRDFMDVRRIRNECRDAMTHDQDVISRWKQLGFWLYHARLGYVVYVFRCKGKAVAYGLIRTDHLGTEWISGGVAAKERGKGYGLWLFGFLTAVVKKPGWLDVFAENLRARVLYRKLGWLELERLDTALGTIYVMTHD